MFETERARQCRYKRNENWKIEIRDMNSEQEQKVMTLTRGRNRHRIHGNVAYLCLILSLSHVRDIRNSTVKFHVIKLMSPFDYMEMTYVSSCWIQEMKRMLVAAINSGRNVT